VTDDAELKFYYVGPIPDEKKAISSIPAMLSAENLHLIIVRAWTIGRYQITNHFRQRAKDRGFDVLDAENAIRRGKLRGGPEYCADFSNWKCRVIGPVEERYLEVVVGLDDFEDYECPLIIPITGYWREKC
jgi:hypothetical protein